MDPASLTRRIVFVGAGPRVIALIDRIGSHARATRHPPLTLVLVDPYPAGAGRVWSTEQPRSLLNNTSAADTTVFCDDTIRSAAPIEAGPSLYEWCASIGVRHPDSAVRAEAVRMQPWSKPPRALQGEYYRWALREVAARHANVLRVEERRAHVERVDLVPRPSVLLDDGSRIEADGVILSMGFVDDNATEQERDWERFAVRQNLQYRSPGMVDRLRLDGLDFRRPTLVRGLGATFFDVLGLIEESSGPDFPARLFVGSDTGLPKRAQPDGPGPELPPARLTDSVVASMIGPRASESSTDAVLIWQIVHADLQSAFDRHAEALPFEVPGTDHFDWRAVANPTWDGSTSFDRTLDSFFAQESVTTDTPHRSPWAAVRKRVLEIRPRVAALIDGGALSASDAAIVRETFLHPASRLTSGPPAARQRLLRRWHHNGRVQFIGARTRFATGESSFVAHSPARPGRLFEANQFIEARQSFGSAADSSSPVVRALLLDGHAQAISGGGGLRVNATNHRIELDDETANLPCWVVGHLARSTQRGVFQGAIPKSGDPFLQEADAIGSSIVERLRSPEKGF